MKHLILIILSGAFLFSCTPREEKTKDRIKALEDSLFSSNVSMFDKTKAEELVKVYLDFAEKFPSDSLAPGFLFKAGNLLMNLSDPKKAIDCFDKIITKYPGFEKSPQSLFLKAFIYENHLNDLVKAKDTYMEFIRKYPENEFADDAQVSIQNLGKSPEELIKEFEKKALNSDSAKAGEKK